MRVLFINPNHLKPPVTPIGILYVAAYLRCRGIDAQLLDMCFNDYNEESIKKELEGSPPDLIAIGIRNVDNVFCLNSEYYLPELKNQIEKIKLLYSGPIVIGGAGYSIFPREIMVALDVDFGIVGEGEKSLYLLCEALQGKGSLDGIAGLVYRKSGNIVMNPIKNLPSEELDEIPLPALDLADIQRYYHEGGVCSIQTKRGCALDCVYCSYPVVEGRSFRLRSPDAVIKEMKEMINIYGFKYFYFVDSIFNVPFEHAESICDGIIKEKLDIQWYGYVSPKGFTEERLLKMIKSGADGLWLSVDTCSDTMLKNMGKGFTREEIVRAVEIFKKLKVDFNFLLLFGGPGECERTIDETFDFLEEYDPNMVIIYYGLRIYPDTHLHRLVLNGEKACATRNYLEPTFYMPSSDGENMIDLVRERVRGHENWFATLDKPNRKETLANLLMEKKVHGLYLKGVRGPYWAVVDKLRKMQVK